MSQSGEIQTQTQGVSFYQTRAYRRMLYHLGVYLLLLAGSVVMLIPLLWMVSTALKPADEVFQYPPSFMPGTFLVENFWLGWTTLPFTLYTRNTLIITVNNIIGNLLSCSLAAYGFARLRSRTRDVFFVMVLSTMMIPQDVTMIPTFILFKTLGWVDTFLPLTIPAWFGYPFFIFLLRQFFMTIPLELDDAARIDGCTTFRIYWNIVLPLAKPALATVTIFAFIGNWNNFLGPLVYLHTTDNYTLALGLMQFRGQYGVDFPKVMSVSIIAVLPILIIFFLAQNYFVRGVALTGIKG